MIICTGASRSLSDAALDRIEGWLREMAGDSYAESARLAQEELDALRALRTECGRLRGQRSAACAAAVKQRQTDYAAWNGEPFEDVIGFEGDTAELLRRQMNGLDPTEAARLAAIVFPEGE